MKILRILTDFTKIKKAYLHYEIDRALEKKIPIFIGNVKQYNKLFVDKKAVNTK